MSDLCLPPLPVTSKPPFDVPPDSCDCHAHVLGPVDGYPYTPERSYTPPDAPVDRYLAALAALGITRMVLVQPSVYGTDNRRMLDAMREIGPACRGVAVLDPSVSPERLRALHEAGVRGIRINNVTPSGTALRHLEEMAGKIAPLGWHIQLYQPGDRYVDLQARLLALPVPVVIDHMGQVDTALGVDSAAFRAILRLLDSGKVWIKLSGAYRVSSRGHPYSDVASHAATLVRHAAERCVWGTDWPHTDLRSDMPEDGHLMALLADWAADPETRRRILVENPAVLYDFRE